jgi:hypothetical protein
MLPPRGHPGLGLVLIAALGLSMELGAQPPAARPGGRALVATVPDLQGTYTTATLTPLERPAALRGRPTLTPQEADAFARSLLAAVDSDRRDGGADVDVAMARVDGTIRTSIVVDPPDGRLPRLTPEGARRVAARDAGGFDHPEQRPLEERCLAGIGSTTGPPALPALYNNIKQIVQTPDRVVIVSEMVHDARVVRLGGTHLPASVRRWTGDSVGRYDGDTLVIDTINFMDRAGFLGTSDRLHVIERIRRLDADTLLYRFTVEDPSTWAQPWSGEYPWVATSARMFEYACHEGNSALANMLRGARFDERR